MSATKQQETEADEFDLSGSVELSNVTALEAITKGEIDSQVRTAKAFPRSITVFRRESAEMVTLDVETAEACIYAVPRGGKTVTGPSVRFAEIILSAWGNCRAGYRPIEEADRYVTAQGVFADLQRNIGITAEVRRGIVDKKGRRYKDDMINTTMNAAGSVALRNSILRGIPKALWLPVYNAAVKVAIGDASTLVDRRQKAIEFFSKMGVTAERLLARLGKPGVDDIDLQDMETLTGLKTAIKDGLPVDVAFEPKGANGTEGTAANGKEAADQLAQRLKAEREGRVAQNAPSDEQTKDATAQEMPAGSATAAPESAEAAQPSEDTPKAPEAKPWPPQEDFLKQQRAGLKEAFEALVTAKGKVTAQDALEAVTSNNTRNIVKVADEDLGSVIAALHARRNAK